MDFRSRVHQILTREAYAGTHYFNRTDMRLNRKARSKSEWIVFATPVIIEPETFSAVQSCSKRGVPRACRRASSTVRHC